MINNEAEIIDFIKDAHRKKIAKHRKKEDLKDEHDMLVTMAESVGFNEKEVAQIVDDYGKAKQKNIKEAADWFNLKIRLCLYGVFFMWMIWVLS